jgi:hypothetical protein
MPQARRSPVGRCVFLRSPTSRVGRRPQACTLGPWMYLGWGMVSGWSGTAVSSVSDPSIATPQSLGLQNVDGSFGMGGTPFVARLGLIARSTNHVYAIASCAVGYDCFRQMANGKWQSERGNNEASHITFLGAGRWHCGLLEPFALLRASQELVPWLFLGKFWEPWSSTPRLLVLVTRGGAIAVWARSYGRALCLEHVGKLEA